MAHKHTCIYCGNLIAEGDFDCDLKPTDIATGKASISSQLAFAPSALLPKRSYTLTKTQRRYLMPIIVAYGNNHTGMSCPIFTSFLNPSQKVLTMHNRYVTLHNVRRQDEPAS